MISRATSTDISETIISLEKSALEKWNQGDPSGYIDLSANDVVYFDPFTEQRLDGIEILKKYLEPIKGLAHVSKYEMLNPKVHAVSEMAVLTFNLFSYEGDNVYKWNCTEVYRFEKSGQWKIIQTHWSFIRPDLK
jgi:ketosteroid isomerase-like protein